MAVATITWADVVGLAPALSTIASGTQTAILAAANVHVANSEWGDSANLAATLLAAHFATALYSGAGASASGPVASKTVGSMSVSYAVLASENGLERTGYGREYLRLVRNTAAFRGPMVA